MGIEVSLGGVAAELGVTDANPVNSAGRCSICKAGNARFAFELPVLDGPYANETAYAMRSFFRCAECGFLFVDPFEPRRYADYYGRLNGNYHTLHDADTSRYRMIAQTLSRPEAFRVLDWGCGTGEFLAQLPIAADRYGVELSAAARAAAKAKGIKTVVESELGGPAFLGTFDAVTAIDVAEHIRNLAEWTRKVAGLLKPGGHFLIMTGDLDSRVARTLGRRWSYVHCAEHISFLTERAARILLAEQFEDIQLKAVTHHPITRINFMKSAVKFAAGWTMEKLGAASKFRIQVSLPAVGDHMLIVARRRRP